MSSTKQSRGVGLATAVRVRRLRSLAPPGASRLAPVPSAGPRIECPGTARRLAGRPGCVCVAHLAGCTRATPPQFPRTQPGGGSPVKPHPLIIPSITISPHCPSPPHQHRPPGRVHRPGQHKDARLLRRVRAVPGQGRQGEKRKGKKGEEKKARERYFSIHPSTHTHISHPPPSDFSLSLSPLHY